MDKEVAKDNLKADIKYWENTSVSVDHLYMAISAMEKLEEIENIITETENQHYELQGKKVVMCSLAYGKINEVIENG